MPYVGPLRAIIQLLKDDADVFAQTSTRIRTGQAAAGDRAAGDYVVLNQISAEHYETMVQSSGMAQVLIQLNGYNATGKSSVVDLMEKVRLALQKRTPGNVTVNGDTVDVRSISLQGERDADEDPVDGSDQRIYGFSQDWKVAFFETIP